MPTRLSKLNLFIALTGLVVIVAWQTLPAGFAQAAAPDEVEPSKSLADDTDGDQKPAQEQSPTRVIVKVNRNLTITGFLELLDNEVVVVRDLKNNVHRLSRTRVLSITKLVDPQPGQTGVVFRTDGRTSEGIIIEDHFDYVLMEIEGVRAKISRPNVDYVVLEPTFKERYTTYKETLLPGQTRRHFALCQWLVDNKKYELAKTELEALLSYENDRAARKLLNLVKAQLTLRSGNDRTDRNTTNRGNQSTADNASDPIPSTIISEDDVNIIRVYEIDFDNPPKMTISPDTIRALIDQYSTNSLLPASQTERTALFRADPVNIARLMFELRARELYAQINVMSEPPALNEFRLRVHDAWLINNCTTSRCHGGVEAGDFFLHRKNYKNERVRYTNLLILERLVIDEQWPLINYDDPMLSLIIQYALPKHAARKAHPDVPGWKPVFTRGNRRTLHASLNWIRSMYQPRPKYPVDYDPPKLNQPAPKPATNDAPGKPNRPSR